MEKSEKPLPQHKQDFLDWLAVERGLSAKSQENYSRFIKRFFDWLETTHLENLKPHELTAQHVRDYRLYLSRQLRPKSLESLKKSTQNYYIIALRSLLSHFAEKDVISLSIEKVKLARDKTERQVRFLSLDQLEELFAAPDLSTYQGMRDRAILEIFFSTGLRIAELVNLNREQFKIKPGVTELELRIMGKGGRIRTVYFSERALLWVKKYLEIRKDDHKALFGSKPGKKSTPDRLSPRSIQKSMKRYVVKAGLPEYVTPHVMRHSFSTDLLAKGVDIRVLQEFLGHKDISATQIYAHVTNKQLREIHKKFHGGSDLKTD